MSNRIKDLEETTKEKLRQYMRHRSPENLKHLKAPANEWMRAERETA